MKLTKKTGAYLVLPQNPTPREQFAAEELQKYVKKICGAKLAVTDTLQTPAIILGGPQGNPAAAQYISTADFDKACPGPEGIFLQSYGSDVLLVAGSRGDYERGTIYAVYELLERYFGASFGAFSDPAVQAGEFVPCCEELNTDGISYCKAACDLPYRTACVQYGASGGDVNRKLNVPFFDWLCKNRYNRIFTWTRNFEDLKPLGVLEEAERRGIRFTVGHHSACDAFMPPHGNSYFPEAYYETHPEFYKLLADGTRYESSGVGGQWIFCSRNETFIATLIENVKTWLRQNPMVDIVSFPPKDGIEDQCTCEMCAPYSKVENYLYVMNALAEGVTQEFPDIKIEIMAYFDLFACPEGAKLHPALMVQESTWHDSGLRNTGKKDGSCLLGTFFEDNLLKWHDAGAQVTYYDYHMGVYPSRQRYIPMADEMQAMYQGFVKKGIAGSATQIESFNLWNHLFNFYCFARTCYDTGLSMADNYARFGRIFGEGAPEMWEVISYAEDLLDGQENIGKAGWWLIRNIDKEKVYNLYDRALAKTTDPRARNNIRLMRMEFRYTDLEAQQAESPEFAFVYITFMDYTDKTGEMHCMTEFDSFSYNNPGYGITFPYHAPENPDFQKGIWYTFD